MANDFPIKAAVVTVSDSRTAENDLSGDLLVLILNDFGAEIIEKQIVSDDFDELRQTLYTLSERENINLIITTGGTGYAMRDNTPEATQAVIEKEAHGLAEAMRRETAKINPKSILSRGVCGIRNQTLLINLPGSPKGVAECFEVLKPVLQHAINLLEGNTKH